MKRKKQTFLHISSKLFPTSIHITKSILMMDKNGEKRDKGKIPIHSSIHKKRKTKLFSTTPNEMVNMTIKSTNRNANTVFMRVYGASL